MAYRQRGEKKFAQLNGQQRSDCWLLFGHEGSIDRLLKFTAQNPRRGLHSGVFLHTLGISQTHLPTTGMPPPFHPLDDTPTQAWPPQLRLPYLAPSFSWTHGAPSTPARKRDCSLSQQPPPRAERIQTLGIIHSADTGPWPPELTLSAASLVLATCSAHPAERMSIHRSEVRRGQPC